MADLVDPGRGCVWVHGLDKVGAALVPLSQITLDSEGPDAWYCRWYGVWEPISRHEAIRIAGLIAAYWDRRAGPDGLGDRGA